MKARLRLRSILLLLLFLPYFTSSFPKFNRPSMNRKPSNQNKKNTGLSLFSKIGIATASLLGGYWAITSIFFPQSLGGGVQFETVEDIPAIYFKEKTEIPAFVVKVTDGDTYRVRHLANKNSRDFKGSLKEHTIPIRLAAVDTPEVAKQGQPGQRFGDVAKKFAQDRILNKEVSVKLLGKDQYNRVIGLVKYKSEGKEYDLAEELLKNGYAVVYRQGGARYDGKIERWNSLENMAKIERKGIWEDGVENVQLPSDYKRAMRSGAMAGDRQSTGAGSAGGAQYSYGLR